ncbi:MAG TPA: hypothetical protein VFJ82_13200 [Longimicrobium sp.]|nr:hypothetical protein [Longimicrobium sp.]
MRKKLSLNVDQIDVTSFETDRYEDVRGTVAANDDAITIAPRCGGTVMIGQVVPDDCTSGCVCCRHRPARLPQV